MDRYSNLSYGEEYEDVFNDILRVPLPVDRNDALKVVMGHLEDIAVMVDIFSDDPEFQAALSGIIIASSITISSTIRDTLTYNKAISNGILSHISNIHHEMEMDNSDYYVLVSNMGKVFNTLARRLQGYMAQRVMGRLEEDLGSLDSMGDNPQIRNLLRFLRKTGRKDDRSPGTTNA